MHHKGKRSERKKLFEHHWETISNPLNFVMISSPIYLKVPVPPSPPKKKPMALALLSPHDVMDPILRGLRRWWEGLNCEFAEGKMWILLTNYGRSDEESGSALISPFLRREGLARPQIAPL